MVVLSSCFIFICSVKAVNKWCSTQAFLLCIFRIMQPTRRKGQNLIFLMKRCSANKRSLQQNIDVVMVFAHACFLLDDKNITEQEKLENRKYKSKTKKYKIWYFCFFQYKYYIKMHYAYLFKYIIIGDTGK